MSHCHMPEGIDVFTADGLTFGVRISDGLVAVAAGGKEASARLVVRRLKQEVTTPTDPSRTTLDPSTEPLSITLMVAQKCNLRCTYCYGVNGEYGSPGLPISKPPTPLSLTLWDARKLRNGTSTSLAVNQCWR